MSRKMKLLGLALLALMALAAFASAPASAAFSIESFDVTYEDRRRQPGHPGRLPPLRDDQRHRLLRPRKARKAKPSPTARPRTSASPCPRAWSATAARSRSARTTTSSSSTTSTRPANAPMTPRSGCCGCAPPVKPAGGDLGPAFNLAPPPGAAAKIGFILLHVPVALLVKVNPVYPHNLIATTQNTSDVEPLGGVSLTIWGDPSDEAHDEERGQCAALRRLLPGPRHRPRLPHPAAQLRGPAPHHLRRQQLGGTAELRHRRPPPRPLQTDGCENSSFERRDLRQADHRRRRKRLGPCLRPRHRGPGLTESRPRPSPTPTSEGRGPDARGDDPEPLRRGRPRELLAGPARGRDSRPPNPETAARRPPRSAPSKSKPSSWKGK